MKKRILINIDSYEESIVNRIISTREDSISVVLYTNINSKYKYYKNRYSKILHIDNINYFELNTDIIECISYVLNDENTALFFDRHFPRARKVNHGPGINNYYRYIATQVIKRYKLYKKVNCDYCYYASTPHQIESWVSVLVGEKLGVTPLLPHISPVPWRRHLYAGIRRDREKCQFADLTLSRAEDDLSNLENWIGRVQSNYEEAIPDYEKERLEKNRGEYFRLSNEIRRFWKKPHFIVNKWNCFKEYKRLSKIITDTRYIVFFLHYQPERTTLPEGYGFSQQLNAIIALRSALPPDVKIIVKEHPSTFTNVCIPSQRHPSFYRDIQSIPNVELADISQNSFDLIDKAAAVITISGTVGVEALLRGKPVAYLGVPTIISTYGSYVYDNIEGLRDFLKLCLLGIDKEKIVKSTIQSMKESMNDSISIADSDGIVRNRHKKLEECKYELLISAIEGKIKM